MEEKVFGYIPSKMDGSEIEFSVQDSMEIPEKYSYVKHLPKVLNQGDKPICVPCSLSAHINWNINIDNDKDNDIDHKVKLLDIYGIKTNQGDGMTFKEALHYLRHNGVNTSNGNAKIEKYALVNSIDALKTALVLNGPCVGALPVYSNGMTEFWKETKGCAFLGGHAISIVGFNSDGFIIRNSWGEMYGQNGYSILMYKDFKSFYEIWTIID